MAQAAAGESMGTLYLTLDTGWMNHAERIAGILARHGIAATLFLANEPTFRGDHSLDDGWADYWRARAAEGHSFGSHTWRHWYLRGDTEDGRVRYVAWSGGQEERLDRAGFCREL